VILTFFEKMENTKAEMDFKFKFTTCFYKAFFLFMSHFGRSELRNFAKVLRRTPTTNFLINSVGIEKCRFLCQISNPSKKFRKKFYNKSFEQKTLINSSKSQETLYCLQLLIITFWVNFFATFQ
jgi:hypothetical protein